ncbi:uncharacterized protein SPPG_07717 [Spizellomyces punctatus DAOM BR117]|uniref:Uncharacterized protein n=1 Tax=Spizellomyces punctatus (strain DAOM BR117) TaxID=645134 RepID=A0A0L0H7E6_SPIPD|nr:uncharacterized protein SPPG_07717 [Spizellomyces punctatus DAOM BR117]KNC96889.1 hypothetical protein SPPG_07717 [Spizellomyces punctatus DAOM BR117]|eukprot:XP_016604929.1 hypothetical protein SPPG_07717 [Spizellomyces punctatus DAOM BR117]
MSLPEKLCGGKPWGPWVDSDFTDCFERSIIVSIIPTAYILLVGTFALLRHVFWQRRNLDPRAYLPVLQNDPGRHGADNDYGAGDESYPVSSDEEGPRRRDMWVWICLLGLALSHIGVSLIGYGIETAQNGNTVNENEPYVTMEVITVTFQWLYVNIILGYLTVATCPANRPSLYFPCERSKRKSLCYLLSYFGLFALCKSVQLRSVWAWYGSGHMSRAIVIIVGAQASIALVMLAMGAWISGERLLRRRRHIFGGFQSEHREPPASRETGASLYAKFSFSWFNNVIERGYRKTLDMNDVPHLVDGDKAANVCDRFNRIRLQHSSLLRALYHLVRPELSIQAAYAFVSALLSFSGPYLLNRILAHVSRPREDSSPKEGLAYTFALLITALIRAACDGQVYFNGRRIGTRVRAVLIGQIYGKALRRRAVAVPTKEEQAGASTGQITNLMSVDTQKILEVSCYIMYLWTAPLQIAICVTLLMVVLGWPAIAGLAVMIAMLPIGATLGKMVAMKQKMLIKATDRRITAMNETLQGIRIVKFFAWETHYFNMLTSYRNSEINRLRGYLYTVATSRLLWYAAPIIVSFLTFMTFTIVAHRELTAEIAFTGLALFNALRQPLQLFPDMIVRVSEALVSMKRVEDFLGENELERYQSEKADGHRAEGGPGSEDGTEIVGFTGPAKFSWQGKDGDSDSMQKEFVLKDLEITFPVGGLSLVVGTTGCGKTSLVMALLGEMNRLAGEVYLPDSRYGRLNPSTGLTNSVAYAAQQAWLMNATIRDNILFGQPYDPAKYDRVIHACALLRDLETLEGGDMTEIGEKGVNLSGGQKARISLARAAYSPAAFVLMDDPLSAVDAPTARHLFEHCILGLLGGRTRVLVTHAVHLCVPRADHVVVMRRGGIATQGPPSAVVGRGPGKIDLVPDEEREEGLPTDSRSLTTLYETPEAEVEKCDGEGDIMSTAPSPEINDASSMEPLLDMEDGDSDPDQDVDIEFDDGASLESDQALRPAGIQPSQRKILRLTEDEARAVGSVKGKVYWAYISAAGGFVFLMALIFAYLTVQLSTIGQDWWLKSWAAAYRRATYRVTMGGSESPQIVLSVFPTYHLGPSSKLEDRKGVNYYLIIYALIGLLTMLTLFIRILVNCTGSLHASRHLHSAMLARLLHAPMRFFDTTPMGRILNRFSKDVQSLDQEVAAFGGDFLSNTVAAVGVVAVVAVVTPVFLGGIVPIALIYISVARLYLRTSRELKRLESTTRSPIFSHFSETIVGASTIRAYGAEDKFMKENYARVDTNHRAFFYLWVSNRWLGVRVDLVGAMVSFCSAAAILATVHWGHGMDPGAAGLSLSYALTFTDSLLWVVRMHALMEMSMNSVERIQEYLSIEQEAPPVIEGSRPPVSWPAAGRVEFQDLTVRYSADLTPVLRHVNFIAKAGEKVGIVGRTGAGKSTLSLALFRFLEASGGRILVDDIDISQIGLQDLRSRLTIIPQDPILFTGTVRSNLDPFSEHTDLQLWTALRRAHLLDSHATAVSIPGRDAAGVSCDGSSLTTNLVQDRTGSLVPSRHQSLTPTPTLSRRASVNSLASETRTTRRRSSNTSLASYRSANILTLDTIVSEGGQNFSQGQRQLLCLARALLRSCKVIVLDEATASVDHETDARIQETIRTEFRGATLLCVAHRLRTVADYDKILVLSQGTVAEFGSPYELMTKPPGPDAVFRGMCEETGEYPILVEMAKRADKDRGH